MTFRRCSVILLLATMLVLALSGCVPAQAELDAHATRVASEIYATLGDGGPTAAEIYAAVAPSVVYIETDELSTGSGLLIEESGEKFVATNAHVIWPYTEVRAVFPDGEEFLDIPVVQNDLLRDLSVLGPIDTDKPPLDLTGSNEVVVGDEAYLIGYPAEGESFPQPAISRGLISRVRAWPSAGVDYFQTDTAVAGGQSGGVLVSDDGSIIGISGMSFGEARAFALSIDAADVHETVGALARGEDVNGLGARPISLRGRRLTATAELPTPWSRRVLIFSEDLGTMLEIEADSESDLGVYAVDSAGGIVEQVDYTLKGAEVLTMEVGSVGPTYVIVEHYANEAATARLRANHRFTLFENTEEDQPIAVGESQVAALDYYDDVDTFVVQLDESERVFVNVDSTGIDPFVDIGPADAAAEDYVYDDDSGRGMLGTNASLVFTAPESGDYRIVVQDSIGGAVGAYVISIEEE